MNSREKERLKNESTVGGKGIKSEAEEKDEIVGEKDESGGGKDEIEGEKDESGGGRDKIGRGKDDIEGEKDEIGG